MFIEHVNLTVSNLDRSVDFYQDLFGWTTRWRGNTNDGRPAAHLGDDRCYVALFEAAADGRHASDYDRVGFIDPDGFEVELVQYEQARV